jgi:hypothetical protein
MSAVPCSQNPLVQSFIFYKLSDIFTSNFYPITQEPNVWFVLRQPHIMYMNASIHNKILSVGLQKEYQACPGVK